MYFRIGTKTFSAGEVGIRRIAARALRRNGITYGTETVWDLFGMTHADNATALTLELAAVEAAFRQQGVDAGFYEDNGTPTQHRLQGSQLAGGLMVEPVSYEAGVGAEYTTYRNWTVSLLGRTRDASVQVVEWEESLTFIGGGPEYAFLPCIDAPPVKQLVKQYTTFKAIQSGRALGLLQYIPPAAPLWGTVHEHQHLRQLLYGLPDRIGKPGQAEFENFPTTWTYYFESVTPLVGSPTSWPQ